MSKSNAFNTFKYQNKFIGFLDIFKLMFFCMQLYVLLNIMHQA